VSACPGRAAEATARGDGCGGTCHKPLEALSGWCDARIHSSPRWRYWGEGGRAGGGPRPAQGAIARGGRWAIEPRPTGPASWAQRQRTVCGERLPGRRGQSASKPPAETQRVLLATGSRHRPAGGRGLATESRPAGRVWDRIQPAGWRAKRRFSPAGDMRPDPNGTRRPSGCGGARPAHRAGDHAGLAAGTPSAPLASPAAGFGGCSAPALENTRQDTRPLKPRAVAFWGPPWPWPEPLADGAGKHNLRALHGTASDVAAGAQASRYRMLPRLCGQCRPAAPLA